MLKKNYISLIGPADPILKDISIGLNSPAAPLQELLFVTLAAVSFSTTQGRCAVQFENLVRNAVTI